MKLLTIQIGRPNSIPRSTNLLISACVMSTSRCGVVLIPSGDLIRECGDARFRKWKLRNARWKRPIRPARSQSLAFHLPQEEFGVPSDRRPFRTVECRDSPIHPLPDARPPWASTPLTQTSSIWELPRAAFGDRWMAGRRGPIFLTARNRSRLALSQSPLPVPQRFMWGLVNRTSQEIRSLASGYIALITPVPLAILSARSIPSSRREFQTLQPSPAVASARFSSILSTPQPSSWRLPQASAAVEVH